jgi:hypothetical protein
MKLLQGSFELKCPDCAEELVFISATPDRFVYTHSGRSFTEDKKPCPNRNKVFSVAHPTVEARELI